MYKEVNFNEVEIFPQSMLLVCTNYGQILPQVHVYIFYSKSKSVLVWQHVNHELNDLSGSKNYVTSLILCHFSQSISIVWPDGLGKS